VWKVISDHDSGIIRVYDEKGELIYERRGLQKEIISIIETNFLTLVAADLSEDKTEKEHSSKSASELIDNPMYV
jgi:hypothetical protein